MVFDLSVLYYMAYLTETLYICIKSMVISYDMVTQTFLFMSYLPLIDLKKVVDIKIYLQLVHHITVYPSSMAI